MFLHFPIDGTAIMNFVVKCCYLNKFKFNCVALFIFSSPEFAKYNSKGDHVPPDSRQTDPDHVYSNVGVDEMS